MNRSTPTTPPRQPNNHGPRGHNTPMQLHQSSGVPHGHVPAFLPGSASLVEELDREVLVVLRDGRHLAGKLCSYDQYSNLVLEQAVERRIVISRESGAAFYADIPLGIYVVRGDTVVILGEIGGQQPMQKVSIEELKAKAEESRESAEWDFDGDLIA